MRLSAAQAILYSRVGRQLLGTFFVLVAVPVGAMSFLAYHLTEYVVRHSAAQLSSELAKALSISLIGRLRAAERLLQVYNLSALHEPGSVLLDPALQAMFVSVERLAQTEAGPKSSEATVLLVTDAVQSGGAPSVELLAHIQGAAVRGRLSPDYLWDNAQSGTHRICFAGPQLSAAFCQGVELTAHYSVQSQREIFFRPYFDAPTWTITITGQEDVRRYLPIGLAALVANVAGIVFLLALASSSVLLRRLTQPLDALTSGTKAVLAGDFTRRVQITGRHNEFTDLAESFNAMTEEVGRDLRLFRVLAEMDKAIIAQRPFVEIAKLMLGHMNLQLGYGTVGVVQWSSDAPYPSLLSYELDGSLRQHETRIDVEGNHSASGSEPWQYLLIEQTARQRAWIRLEQLPEPNGRAHRELTAFRQRLAVALHAELHEQQMLERATHDSLTGLLNRFGLTEAIGHLTHDANSDEGARHPSSRFAVVYMDLDGFKEINDAYGHSVGDSVLREVAVRLRNSIGHQASALARVGGDEFVFVVPADTGGAFRADIEFAIESVRQPCNVPPRLLPVAASIGIALFPDHGTSHDELLRNADLAMYSAKSAGRNALKEFDPALSAELADRLALRLDLHQALKTDQMFVVFQPRVGAQDRQIVSVEALLRWRHPDRGLIPPDIFIALAEESGFIIELGLWVLHEALQQFAIWRLDPLVPIRHLSVNLSPVQLADPTFPASLQSLLQESDIRPGELELEVTEGSLIQDIDAAVTRLTALRARGVAVALDDFGVGYSAMRYLSRLPFDTLKIDKSFVLAFGVERPALAIATAIVALAKALDKRVVAEGVETSAQADTLQGLEVHELQGYLYGKPQTAAELARLWANEEGTDAR
ncbi:MAG: EAL domain-containing protein [Acidovorax sp.]|nr:MAG: EAL domain-containing protein [Acidovorax sp.]